MIGYPTATRQPASHAQSSRVGAPLILMRRTNRRDYDELTPLAVDEELSYTSFAKDYGPFNLYYTFEACNKLHEKLQVRIRGNFK